MKNTTDSSEKNKCKTYTVEQLRELGFAFDLKGNLCTPDVYTKCAQNYKDTIIKSSKEDVINRVVDFLKVKMYDYVHIDYGLYGETETHYLTCDYDNIDDFINDLKNTILI